MNITPEYSYSNEFYCVHKKWYLQQSCFRGLQVDYLYHRCLGPSEALDNLRPVVTLLATPVTDAPTATESNIIFVDFMSVGAYKPMLKPCLTC